MPAMRRCVPVVVLLALGACDGSGGQMGTTPAGAPPGPGRWEQRAPLPEPIAMSGMGAVAGRVYVVGGGRGANENLASVFAYDPKADAWQAAPALPAPCRLPNVASVGARLYVLGCYGLAVTWAFDPASGRWETRKPPPGDVARGAAAVGVHGARILVAGGAIPGRSGNGFNTGVRQAAFTAYDTARDEWAVLPDLPNKRAYTIGGVLGDVFYVVAGSDDFKRVARVDAFDLGAGAWVEQPPVPVELSSGAVAVMGGRIYTLGGLVSGAGVPTANLFSLAAGEAEWTSLAPLPQARYSMGAAVLDGRVYVAGGQTWSLSDPMAQPRDLPTLEVYLPAAR